MSVSAAATHTVHSAQEESKDGHGGSQMAKQVALRALEKKAKQEVK